MNRFVFLLMLLAMPCTGQAQIKLQPEYASGQPVIIEVAYPDAPEGAVPVDLEWTVSGEAGYRPLGVSSIAVWPKFGLKDSRLTVRVSGPLVTADGKYVPKSNRTFEATTLLLGIGPAPDPGPTPDPTPDPTPQPDGLPPIPEPGFRVLIVYETSAKMTMEQMASMFSGEVTDYLNAKCVKGVDGKTPEWRRLDPNVPGDAGDLWMKAIARGQKTLPWIVISDGKHGYEGPLPKDKAAMLELLRKYGGQ